MKIGFGFMKPSKVFIKKSCLLKSSFIINPIYDVKNFMLNQFFLLSKRLEQH